MSSSPDSGPVPATFSGTGTPRTPPVAPTGGDQPLNLLHEQVAAANAALSTPAVVVIQDTATQDSGAAVNPAAAATVPAAADAAAAVVTTRANNTAVTTASAPITVAPASGVRGSAGALGTEGDGVPRVEGSPDPQGAVSGQPTASPTARAAADIVQPGGGSSAILATSSLPGATDPASATTATVGTAGVAAPTPEEDMGEKMLAWIGKMSEEDRRRFAQMMFGQVVGEVPRIAKNGEGSSPVMPTVSVVPPHATTVISADSRTTVGTTATPGVTADALLTGAVVTSSVKPAEAPRDDSVTFVGTGCPRHFKTSFLPAGASARYRQLSTNFNGPTGVQIPQEVLLRNNLDMVGNRSSVLPGRRPSDATLKAGAYAAMWALYGSGDNTRLAVMTPPEADILLSGVWGWWEEAQRGPVPCDNTKHFAVGALLSGSATAATIHTRLEEVLGFDNVVVKFEDDRIFHEGTVEFINRSRLRRSLPAFEPMVGRLLPSVPMKDMGIAVREVDNTNSTPRTKAMDATKMEVSQGSALMKTHQEDVEVTTQKPITNPSVPFLAGAQNVHQGANAGATVTPRIRFDEAALNTMHSTAHSVQPQRQESSSKGRSGSIPDSQTTLGASGDTPSLFGRGDNRQSFSFECDASPMASPAAKAPLADEGGVLQTSQGAGLAILTKEQLAVVSARNELNRYFRPDPNRPGCVIFDEVFYLEHPLHSLPQALRERAMLDPDFNTHLNRVLGQRFLPNQVGIPLTTAVEIALFFMGARNREQGSSTRMIATVAHIRDQVLGKRGVMAREAIQSLFKGAAGDSTERQIGQRSLRFDDDEPQSNSRPPRREIRCRRCNRPGHMARDCRSNNGNQRGAGGGQGGNGGQRGNGNRNNGSGNRQQARSQGGANANP